MASDRCAPPWQCRRAQRVPPFAPLPDGIPSGRVARLPPAQDFQQAGLIAQGGFGDGAEPDQPVCRGASCILRLYAAGGVAGPDVPGFRLGEAVIVLDRVLLLVYKLCKFTE